jgi:protein-glutamine gamma-glutamyltransferase
MTPRVLHRRLASIMALAALVAFISGAGTDAPAALVALVVLIVAIARPGGAALTTRVEPVWKIAAILLAARAAWAVFASDGDVVLPMVDLLLLLLCVEALRKPEHGNDGRLYSLSIALFIAASAYRPGVLFLVAFVAFVVVGTVSLLVGHLARATARHHVRAPPPLPHRYLARTAVMSVVCLAMAGLVFATFPRASRAWMGRGAPVETAVVGFGDQVSLGTHGTRIYPNPAVALRVEFPGGGGGRQAARLYWRGRSYDFFDGVRWLRTRGPGTHDPRIAAPRRADMEQLIYGVPLQTPVLFGLPTIYDIVPRSRILPVRDQGDDFSYLGVASPTYTVYSATQPHAAADVRAVPYSVPAALGAYLQLPAVSPALRAVADSLAASAPSAYDRARATERWFREEFAYTLELPRTPRETTLDHFLFVRRAGHCEYFSTAMVVLLRAQGIAARNVNGFLGGEWNEFGNFLTVTQNQAHSWVEVWFPRHGWLTFDPTPVALSTIAAATDTNWARRLRRMTDGFEHRWSKWVLDYDLDRQAELVRRVADVWVEPETGAVGVGRHLWLRRAGAAAAGILLVAVVVLIIVARRPPAARPGEATKLYLRLRRAYAAAGYIVPSHVAPLAFARALTRAGAPGAEDASRAVHGYLALRFGNDGSRGFGRDDALAVARAAGERAQRTLRQRRTAVRPTRDQSSRSGSVVRG